MLLAAADAADASSLGWDLQTHVKQASMRKLGLIGAMVAVVAAVAGVAFWDASREATAELQDFAQEQVTLAHALGTMLQAREAAGAAMEDEGARAALRSLERDHALVILLHRPGEAILRTTDGRHLSATPGASRLVEAMAVGTAAVAIPRAEASEFGLPARTALAGLARVGDGGQGTWDVAAVATAERERDRGVWARRRLMLSVLTAAGLVLVFGGLAMRNQRKELVLEHELAVSSLQQSRDERLQRASKAAAMGTLAMGVAHEISTPLGVIAARAEQMMPRVGADQRLSAGLSAILTQADRINQVMRGLLGLARGDAPSAERIAPRDMVESALAMVEHRFQKAGVAWTWSPPAPDLPAVLGDSRLLEHAVVNLLLNACDACRAEGAVTIELREDGDAVEIVVEDSGTGISPADAGRALEPFFTTKAREGGTGLGLAIAHEIVASHRGTLTFSPARPRGTRAVIRLPRARGGDDG